MDSLLQLAHSCVALSVLTRSVRCWHSRNCPRQCQKSHRRSSPRCCAARSGNSAASRNTQTRPPPPLAPLRHRLHHSSSHSFFVMNWVSRSYTYCKKEFTFKFTFTRHRKICPGCILKINFVFSFLKDCTIVLLTDELKKNSEIEFWHILTSKQSTL